MSNSEGSSVGSDPCGQFYLPSSVVFLSDVPSSVVSSSDVSSSVVPSSSVVSSAVVSSSSDGLISSSDGLISSAVSSFFLSQNGEFQEVFSNSDDSDNENENATTVAATKLVSKAKPKSKPKSKAAKKDAKKKAARDAKREIAEQKAAKKSAPRVVASASCVKSPAVASASCVKSPAVASARCVKNQMVADKLSKYVNAQPNNDEIEAMFASNDEIEAMFASNDDDVYFPGLYDKRNIENVPTIEVRGVDYQTVVEAYETGFKMWTFTPCIDDGCVGGFPAFFAQLFDGGPLLNVWYRVSFCDGELFLTIGLCDARKFNTPASLTSLQNFEYIKTRIDWVNTQYSLGLVKEETLVGECPFCKGSVYKTSVGLSTTFESNCDCLSNSGRVCVNVPISKVCVAGTRQVDDDVLEELIRELGDVSFVGDLLFNGTEGLSREFRNLVEEIQLEVSRYFFLLDKVRSKPVAAAPDLKP